MSTIIYPRRVTVKRNTSTMTSVSASGKAKPKAKGKAKSKTTAKSKGSASSKTESKKFGEGEATNADIGLYYNYYKRPLNYLFSLLTKSKVSKEDKEKIGSLVEGLRKADKKFGKDHNVGESILDILINQRSLELDGIEESFSSSLSNTVNNSLSTDKCKLFLTMNKKPIGYLVRMLKNNDPAESVTDAIKSLVRGIRKVEAKFVSGHNLDYSPLNVILGKQELSTAGYESESSSRRRTAARNVADQAGKFLKLKKADFDNLAKILSKGKSANLAKAEAVLERLKEFEAEKYSHYLTRPVTVLDSALEQLNIKLPKQLA